MMSYRENTINFAVVMVKGLSSISLPLCLECLVFMLYLHLNQMTQFIQFIFPKVMLVYNSSKKSEFVMSQNVVTALLESINDKLTPAKLLFKL